MTTTAAGPAAALVTGIGAAVTDGEDGTGAAAVPVAGIGAARRDWDGEDGMATGTGAAAVLVTGIGAAGGTQNGTGSGTGTTAVPVTAATAGRNDTGGSSGLWTLVFWHSLASCCNYLLLERDS